MTCEANPGVRCDNCEEYMLCHDCQQISHTSPLGLCDGCKELLEDCVCDELAAEYEEECGPVCDTCGGDMCEGYDACVLAALQYRPGHCRYITGVY